MPWFHAKNKESGAEEFVLISAEGNDSYPPALFDLVQLARRPEEFDDFDGTTLVRNADRVRRHRAIDASQRLSKNDLLLMIEALEARVVAVEALEARLVAVETKGVV